MSTNLLSTQLLQITVAAKLEQPLLDWLLQHPQQWLLEVSTVQQYGGTLTTVGERVSGYRQRVQIALEISAQDWPALQQGLAQDFAHASYRLFSLTHSIGHGT